MARGDTEMTMRVLGSTPYVTQYLPCIDHLNIVSKLPPTPIKRSYGDKKDSKVAGGEEEGGRSWFDVEVKRWR